jgi:hypothetical protein
MIQHTIAEIEARIKKAESVPNENKAELLHLLSTLKAEIAELSHTHVEDAESIAGFTNVSAYEATRDEKKPELLKLSLDGLSSSVTGFEKSHPKLVDAVNRICTTLSNLGI